MAENSFDQQKKAFLSLFRTVAPYKHRYDVFRDFVTMSAIALRNGIHKNPKLEEEYLKLIHDYKKQDQLAFPKLFGQVVLMLDHEAKDVLGTLFEELELKSADKGQFFTPHPISQCMADILACDELEAGKPFITLHEPACGAGGMVLAFVNTLIRAGHNPAQKLWVQAIDIDRTVALMCYIQLSLWNVAAEIVVGDVLTLETREVWHTPAHTLGFWSHKLKKRWEEKPSQEAQEQPISLPAQQVELSELPTAKATQFDFGF